VIEQFVPNDQTISLICTIFFYSSGLQWTSDSRLIAAEEQHFDAKNMAQLNTDNKT
jgi:hypothetical protein